MSIVKVVRSNESPGRMPRNYDTSALANAPRQQRSHELSLRILAAAERVLRRVGPQALTISAVAEEAEVSVGGIYGRFKNRDELLAAIHREVVGKVQSHLEAALSKKFTSLAEVANVFATETVVVFEELGGLLPIVSKASDMTAAIHVERAIRAALTKAIEPFRADFRHSDPDLAVRLTVHLLLASAVRESTSPSTATDRAVGWQTLRSELPKVAHVLLAGIYSCQQ
jgi:AcrR family transcriptional regulator